MNNHDLAVLICGLSCTWCGVLAVFIGKFLAKYLPENPAGKYSGLIFLCLIYFVLEFLSSYIVLKFLKNQYTWKFIVKGFIAAFCVSIITAFTTGMGGHGLMYVRLLLIVFGCTYPFAIYLMSKILKYKSK